MQPLELSNVSNWEITHVHTVLAEKLQTTSGKEKIIPIPLISIPVLFKRHILTIYITTDVPNGSKWLFAGWLYQQFQLELVTENVLNPGTTGRQELSLNVPQLVIFSELITNYSVNIQLPEWFPNASITIWRYIGEDYDVAYSRLKRIEQKIDDLAAFGNP